MQNARNSTILSPQTEQVCPCPFFFDEYIEMRMDRRKQRRIAVSDTSCLELAFYASAFDLHSSWTFSWFQLFCAISQTVYTVGSRAFPVAAA